MTKSKWGNPKTWPKQIIDLRNDLTLTYDDIATETGIRAERIKNLEKGHKSCAKADYVTVLEALDKLLNPVAPQKSPAFVGKHSKKPLSREEALGVSDKDTKADEKTQLGKLLRSTRKQKNLSKEDFALSLGSDQKQVSKLESAHHSCSMEDMRSALVMLKRFY